MGQPQEVVSRHPPEMCWMAYRAGWRESPAALCWGPKCPEPCTLLRTALPPGVRSSWSRRNKHCSSSGAGSTQRWPRRRSGSASRQPGEGWGWGVALCHVPCPPWHVVSCGLCVGRQRAEVEELRRQLEASSSAVTAALKEEYAREKEEQERRHQVCCSSVPWGLAARAGLFWVCTVRSLCPDTTRSCVCGAACWHPVGSMRTWDEGGLCSAVPTGAEILFHVHL